MEKISDSIAEAIRKRTNSAALGTYLFFWCTYHWEGIYTSIFTSEESIIKEYGILKNEYVNQYFFGIWSPNPLMYILGYSIPLVLTAIFICLLPKVLIYAYRLEQDYKTKKRKIRLQEEEKIRQFKIANIEKETKEIQAETKLSATKKKAEKTDPTILWEEDYASFEGTTVFHNFRFIIESIYSHSGKINDGYRFEIPRDILVYCHSNDIVELSQNKDKINLTEKGKYFLKIFSSENNIK